MCLGSRQSAVQISPDRVDDVSRSVGRERVGRHFVKPKQFVKTGQVVWLHAFYRRRTLRKDRHAQPKARNQQRQRA
ncbi:MAG: hypothetical protein DYG94_03785 [Leptolyngbya sp. PLA3]|nr:MAG: hypothetical protein EDM82_08755 [Cyanobacteria bacterium CYA]MCE7967850.1 hypothetical protein [Leptolyngbya sp. PL-A3]